jgi:hypothetical protein
MITWILICPQFWIPIVILYALLVMSGWCKEITYDSLAPAEVDPWQDIANMRQCLGV